MATGVARPVKFRAVHDRAGWRKATFATVADAKEGPRGAKNTFADRGWRSFEEEGQARFIVIWSPEGDSAGWILMHDRSAPLGYREVEVPIGVLLDFEARGGASQEELRGYF